MGLRHWLNKILKKFDEQVEGYGYPVDGARHPAPPPAPRPAAERERLRSIDGVRGPIGNQGTTARPGPDGRRTPAPPPNAPRHRLDPSRRRRDNEADTGLDTDLTIGGALESATPRWVDESGHHDHRHHGHSAAAEHRAEEAPSSSHHTTHHGGHSHGHDSGSWGGGHHTSHDSGGYDGGSASCGSGGGD